MEISIEKPNRKKHSYTQKIYGSPKLVFSLLCPVLEVEWVPGWMPTKVISETGIAEQECVFITPNEPKDAIWIISKYDPENLCIEMYKVVPDHSIAKLEASLAASGPDNTDAFISYEFTAIGKNGEEFLKEFTYEWYERFMEGWEKEMNQYLKKIG